MSEARTVWHNFPDEKTDKEKILNRNLSFRYLVISTKE